MDAISFVLGVQSAQLRGAALRDLVYSFDLADREERRVASVKLVFETEEGEEIFFSRHITASGTGEYRVDGRVCTAEEYAERLKTYGILVKARNFLVFQGDIESVASKSPKDLTGLIEQISGSEELKKDYEEAMKARHRAEEEQHGAFTRRKGLATQRKQMKEQKDEAEKHQRMSEDLPRLRVEHALSSSSTSTSTPSATPRRSRRRTRRCASTKRAWRRWRRRWRRSAASRRPA